jgi:serine/threonine protein kinase
VFNELKILRALDHGNLLKLYEVFEDRNKYYFVMELLQGITLYKEISQRTKKPETELKGF